MQRAKPTTMPRSPLGGVLLLLAACGGGEPTSPGTGGAGPEDEGPFCTIPREELNFFLPPDAIPALADPPLVAPDDPEAAYLEEGDRIVGVVLDGKAVAVPLNILRYHEIVNLDGGGSGVAVSYCPLTGSALVFERGLVGGAELGVSGLLVRNNLVLFDRSDDSSFFVQMRRGRAQCGPLARTGERLELRPSREMRWDAWKELHPDTRVVSQETGFSRRYDINPNEDYEELHDRSVQVEVPIDPRRPPKERVLGIPAGFDGGWAFPFEALRTRERLAMELRHQGRDAVVLWDRSAEAALAYFTEMDGRGLTLRAEGDGFVDARTGSRWRLDGVAVSGPLAGRRLEPVRDAYVAFWFAWAAFHPETGIRTP